MKAWVKRRVSLFNVGIYEIRNWLYVKRIIRTHRKTADWQQYNLRADWIGRIYTVFNPQMPGDKGDTVEVLKLKYADRLKPVNLYLDRLGLGMAVAIASEDVKDSESMLVVWYPIFDIITFWKVFWHLVAIIIFFATKLNTWTYNALCWVWNSIV